MIRAIFEAYRDAFSGLPRRIWLLALVTFVHRSGTMVLPFLAIYATSELGLDVWVAGLLLAAYGVGAMIGAIVSGHLAESVGNVRAMQITLIGAGIGFAVMGLVTSPWALGAVLLLTGMAAEGFRTPSGAEIGVVAGPGIRPRAFALRRLAINAGMTLGPAIGGLLATVHYGWLFALDSLTCLLAAATVWRSLTPRDAEPAPTPAATSPAAGTLATLWSHRRLAAVLGCAAIMTLAFGQLFGVYPLTLSRDYGYSEAFIGAVLAMNTLLIIAFEMLLQHRLGASHPARVASAGCLALAIGFLLVPLDPHTAVVLLAMIVLTIGEMLAYPVIESYVIGLVPRAAMGRAVGALHAVFSGTFVLAPLAGTLIYDAWGYVAVWSIASGLTLAAAAGFLRIGAAPARAAPEP